MAQCARSIKNRFFTSSEVTRVLKTELFQLKNFERTRLMTSLDGKNLHASVCPNPGNSKPSISITLHLMLFKLKKKVSFVPCAVLSCSYLLVSGIYKRLLRIFCVNCVNLNDLNRTFQLVVDDVILIVVFIVVHLNAESCG